MNRNCAYWVVKFHFALDEEHSFDSQNCCKDSDDCGCPRCNKCTWCSDCNEAGQHAVDHHSWVWLTCALCDVDHGCDRSECSGNRRVGSNSCKLNIGCSKCAGRVKSEPAEQQDERSEHRHWNVVTRNCTRLSVCTEFANAWPKNNCTGKSSNATHCMHNT